MSVQVQAPTPNPPDLPPDATIIARVDPYNQTRDDLARLATEYLVEGYPVGYGCHAATGNLVLYRLPPPEKTITLELILEREDA